MTSHKRREHPFNPCLFITSPIASHWNVVMSGWPDLFKIAWDQAKRRSDHDFMACTGTNCTNKSAMGFRKAIWFTSRTWKEYKNGIESLWSHVRITHEGLPVSDNWISLNRCAMARKRMSARHMGCQQARDCCAKCIMTPQVLYRAGAVQ